MSYIVPKEIPNRCGRCPCFHAEHPMYCQAVKADKNKRIYAPYGEGRPDWCPLIEIKTPHGRLIDIKSVEDGKFINAGNEYQKWWNGALESVIKYAQTVIEAEGNEK